jgi:hypothetical protein
MLLCCCILERFRGFHTLFINLLQKSGPKSILGFQKWTKKMSKNEKGRKTFEKKKKVIQL